MSVDAGVRKHLIALSSHPPTTLPATNFLSLVTVVSTARHSALLACATGAVAPLGPGPECGIVSSRKGEAGSKRPLSVMIRKRGSQSIHKAKSANLQAESNAPRLNRLQPRGNGKQGPLFRIESQQTGNFVDGVRRSREAGTDLTLQYRQTSGDLSVGLERGN